jgi:hypothetical protein
MRNCLVELLSLDFDASYQMAFIYIRQVCVGARLVCVCADMFVTCDVCSRVRAHSWRFTCAQR